MKTRSNMPLFVVECEDVKALSNAQIDLLRCGDYLVKKDASGEHAYKVTYKSDTGMCLTYYDASVIETQSYDKIDGVWTYNSEDKTSNLLDIPTESDIEGAIDDFMLNLDSGTPVNVVGFDGDDTLVKGTISGGTKLYKHTIKITTTDYESQGRPPITFYIYSLTQEQYISLSKIYDDISNILVMIDANGNKIVSIDKAGSGASTSLAFASVKLLNGSWTLPSSVFRYDVFKEDTVTEL